MEPRKKIYDNMLELIGNTPMVRLNKIPAGTGSEILVKLEYMNPSGSLKDRIALEMIQGAAAPNGRRGLAKCSRRCAG